MRNRYLFNFLVALLTACSTKHPSDVLQRMTNGTRGKYWELVYATSTDDAIQEVLRNNGLKHRYGPGQVPRYTLLLAPPDKAVSYVTIDSARLVEEQRLASDGILSNIIKPMSDSLFRFQGLVWKVELLNDRISDSARTA